jgi:hypothetical protein
MAAMNDRIVPDGGGVGFTAVALVLGVGLGTLAAAAGFSTPIAMLVGTATAGVGCWAVTSEP